MRTRWLVPGLLLAAVVVAALVLWRATGVASPEGAPVTSTVEQGRRLYATYCAACHGPELRGEVGWKSPRPDGSYPAPPHDVTGHTWHHGDGVLFRIVKEGGALYATPSTPSRMPAFGDQLCDAEVRAVIEFLKSSWGPDERAFQGKVSADAPYPSALGC